MESDLGLNLDSTYFYLCRTWSKIFFTFFTSVFFLCKIGVIPLTSPSSWEDKNTVSKVPTTVKLT